MSCGYVIAACAVLIAVGTIWSGIRTRGIAASRPGETFETFCEAFASEKTPPEALRAVYAKFQEGCSGAAAAFPVRADDDIGHIYGMVDDDLDDAVFKDVSQVMDVFRWHDTGWTRVFVTEKGRDRLSRITGAWAGFEEVTEAISH